MHDLLFGTGCTQRESEWYVLSLDITLLLKQIVHFDSYPSTPISSRDLVIVTLSYKANMLIQDYKNAGYFLEIGYCPMRFNGSRRCMKRQG